MLRFIIMGCSLIHTSTTNSVVAIATIVLGVVSLWNPERCLGFHHSAQTTILRRRFPTSSNSLDAPTDNARSGKANPGGSKNSDKWWEEDYYWFHEDIHTLGNTGVLGGLHAAPFH
jgi:hypothetical protein